MDAADPVMHRNPGADGGSPGEFSRDPSAQTDDTSQRSAPADQTGVGGLDLGALTGLLSLLGGSGGESGGDHAGEHREPEKTPGKSLPQTSGQHDDSAVRLLRALGPYLQDTRVLSVDRVVQLLETARGIRGILHTFGPLLDSTNWKNA